jgi:hypothetical protein
MKKLKASLDMGHMGTWTLPHGGKAGAVVVAYLKWVLKGDETSRALFVGSNASLVQQGWNLTSSGW